MLRRLVLLALLACLTACAGAQRAPSPAPPALAAPEQATYSEFGIASWYGKDHHGHLTANGERFDMHGMTAAHRTLPFDTVLRVTNLRTGAMAKVRVNDRGPFVKGRIIDLSAAAAKALGIDGVTEVRIDTFASDQPQS